MNFLPHHFYFLKVPAQSGSFNKEEEGYDCAGDVSQEYQLSCIWKAPVEKVDPQKGSFEGDENEHVLFPCLAASQSPGLMSSAWKDVQGFLSITSCITDLGS